MSTLLSDYNMQKKLEHVNCGICKKSETTLLFAWDVFANVEYNPCRPIL
jgi:hypothetical protein